MSQPEQQLTESECVELIGAAIQGCLLFVQRWRARQIVRAVAGSRDMFHRDLQYLPLVNDVFVRLRRWAPRQAARALVRWSKEDELWARLADGEALQKEKACR